MHAELLGRLRGLALRPAALAEETGRPRGPVVEALAALQSAGLVAHDARRGYFRTDAPAGHR
jgi:DNA-binding GntR family transcriptional regulator